MIDVSLLNENQKEAVLAEEKYLRIVAGAGSGKTRVLTMRIAHLILDRMIPAYRILAITFTNKAANEMKERVAGMLEGESQQAMICTVHSLCVRILREDIGAIGMPKNFTILDADDQKSILREAYKKFDIDQKTISFPSMLSYISANKTNEVTPQQALASAGSYGDQKIRAQVYAMYAKRLKELYALDFDDLILTTVQIFRKHKDVLAKWQRRYHHIHVDEFQDIDIKQYELIRQLAGVDNCLCVVGDPDQTIYTWRGADVNIIMNLQRDFPSLRTIMLNQNYRSTTCILNGANSVIHNNKNRMEKDLFSMRESDEKITHYASSGDVYEANYVATTIKKLHSEGKSYHDIAILYRSNYLSRAMEKGLLDEKIPYVIYGGTRFYERQEVKDALCFLRMCTTADDLALRRILNKPKRGIGNKSIETIMMQAELEGKTMYEVIRDSRLFSGKTQSSIDQFVKMVESWRMRANDLDKDLYLFFDDILKESGYKKMLEDDRELDRIENLKELIDDVKHFGEDYPDSTLDEYLQMVSLYGDHEKPMESDFVQLMTVHASKGLEFDTVFVIGMNDGIFPSQRSMDDGSRGLEEERRLAYVAFTRAKNKLYITEAAGFSFIIQGERKKSRFIDEIDDAFIEHTGAIVQDNEPMYTKASWDEDEVYEKAVTRMQQQRPTSLANVGGKTMKRGDVVVHARFGQGKVLGVEGPIAKIAFDAPFGVKKIAKNHPTLKLKKDLS